MGNKNSILTDIFSWAKTLVSQQDETVNLVEPITETEETSTEEINDIKEDDQQEKTEKAIDKSDLPVPEGSKEKDRLNSNSIIFLGFEGVLDTTFIRYMLKSKRQSLYDDFGPIFDPECVNWHKKIIEVTGADIVVTSWKDSLSFKELSDMWNYRNLPGEITDVIPTFSVLKGEEIESWLADCHEVIRYVIIDSGENELFNPEQHRHLVHVHKIGGLDKTSAKEAIRILKA